MTIKKTRVVTVKSMPRPMQSILKDIKTVADQQWARYQEEKKTKEFLDWLKQGAPMEHPERGLDIQLPGVEIVVDDGRLEIYMLNDKSERIEGGTFNLMDFTEWVLQFYNKNY
jgi:hypothetical protein